ncbi:hypothetical protein GOBAR_AA23794 [Gossypium barbadense]|uniref:Uncharacterized protein n=1 Tax=Gossypium barbadense TaxID=3634 RepID=A0A2P5X0L0_GOSBA|nr:hypothetical protein GOBAR_AA23794 [Gossypium barbadense]
MLQVIHGQGIQILNFSYEFSFPEGPHQFKDTNDGSFLLPLHVLKTRFHLPLNPFFYHILHDYQITHEWSTPSANVCIFQQTVRTVRGKTWLGRHIAGNSLVIEDVITVKNVFLHYLKGHSPNGYMRGLPHTESNPFVNLLPTPTNVRVVDDVRKVRSLGRDSEDTTSISLEFNDVVEATEVMDLRAALRAQRKRPRTSTSTVNVVVNNEEDTDSGRLELHRKRRADHARTFAMMIIASPSLSLQIAAYESSLVHAVVILHLLTFLLLVCLLLELLLGKNSELASSHKNLNHEEFQDIVEKVVHCSSLASFNITIGSFVFTNCAGGCDSSPASLNMTTRSFALTNYVGGCGSSPASLNMTLGSFTLANYAWGYGFLPTSFNMIARSFAFANCVGGYGSLLASLNITHGSFAITNYAGGL